MAFRDKIKSPDELASLLKDQKSRQQVVFTNGCFDILHSGHVTYLEQARALGSGLIVALNSDDSIRRLKGPERPVNPLADRLEVIAALESTTWVTWFEEDTPIPLLEKLRPAILVKGGDNTPEQIVGAAQVKSWGGEVRSLSFVSGKSTSKIIERARQPHRS